MSIHHITHLTIKYLKSVDEVDKEGRSLNKREYFTCLQGIWDKCDYMLEMYALI
jgi:hypothetical protein